jgi:hypothetical protein
MATKTQLRVETVADGSQARKDFQQTEQAVGALQRKFGELASGAGGGSFSEGFVGSFVKLGAAVEIGQRAAGLVTSTLSEGARAVLAYSASVDQSAKLILGFTKSQEAVAAATALARKEADAGRGTYQETLASLAALTPLANKYHLSLEDVLHTTQLLAASDPVQGFEGAKIAVQEALSGDFTSLARRFELPREAIQKLKDQGVPNLQIVQKVLADLGIDQQFLEIANTSATKQFDLFKGQLIEIGAEISKGLFKDLALGIKDTRAEITEAGSALQTLGDIFHDAERSINDLNADLNKAGNNLGRSILQGLHDIPNSRSADDPVEQWFQEQFRRYDQSAAELGAAAKRWGEQAPAGATAGMKPTPSQITAAQGYGSELLGAYIKGLSPEGLGLFDDLKKTLEEGLKNASPDGKVSDAALRNLLPALAELATEIERNGTVSDATWARVASALGGEAPLVRQLIGDYEALAAAKQQAARASQDLASATATLTEDRAAAAGEAASYADQIKTAQANQAAADKAEEANIKGLTGAHKALGDEARKAANDGAAALIPLNAQLQAAQANAAAVAAGYQAQNDAIQRQIDLNNEVVSQLEHQRDVKFLAIDERLAELRGSKNKDDRREAAELRRERARIERDSKPQIDLERERAQVANYGLEQQQKAIQAAAKAEADRNAASIAGIQAAITKQQELNTATAAGYQKRLDDQQAEIDKITEAHQTRHDDDQDRIAQLQTIADKSATYWAGRIASDQAAVDAAKQLAEYYKAQETASANTLANIQKQIAALAAAGLLTTTVPTVPGQRGGTQGDDNGQNDGPSGPAGAQGGGRDARVTPADFSGGPNGSRVLPPDYAGPGPNPTVYLGTDGQLHPYAPGGAGGYQIPDANGGGAATPAQQPVPRAPFPGMAAGLVTGAEAAGNVYHLNMYGVGEAALLDRIRQAIEGIAAT